MAGAWLVLSVAVAVPGPKVWEIPPWHEDAAPEGAAAYAAEQVSDEEAPDEEETSAVADADSFPDEDPGEGEPDDAAAEEGVVAMPAVHAPVVLPPAPPGRRLSESAPVVLDRLERPDGSAIERLIETSGEIAVHIVNRAGTVQSCRPVGKLQLLRIVEQREAAGGEVVHVVRDDSGALLRYVVDRDGEPRAVALVAPAPR